MPSVSLESLSPFARAALDLDREFIKFEKLSVEIKRQNFATDNGMERAQKLLEECESSAVRLNAFMLSLSEELNNARASMETAAQAVAERSALIQKRKEDTKQIAERFSFLGQRIKFVTAHMNDLQKSDSMDFSECDAQISALIEEARQLKEDAHRAELKTFEGNADSLYQTLQSARSRMSSLLPH